MSKVISFRLNPDNPREAKALKILKEKQAQGLSTRRVLCVALLSMGDKISPNSCSVEDFTQALKLLSSLIERVEEENQEDTHHQLIENKHISLNEDFLSSVKLVVKPGLRIN